MLSLSEHEPTEINVLRSSPPTVYIEPESWYQPYHALVLSVPTGVDKIITFSAQTNELPKQIERNISWKGNRYQLTITVRRDQLGIATIAEFTQTS